MANILSVSSQMIPFIEHNDGIRVNMVDSQVRQAIGLVNGEVPLVRTGREDLYTDYTTFIYRARKDGEIIYTGNSLLKFIVVRYDDNTVDFIDTSIKSTDGVFDITVYPRIKKKDRVKEGDVIAASSHFDKYGRLALGLNLRTAYITYKGYSFEDAIAVSEDASKRFTIKEIFTDNLFLESNEVLLTLRDDKYIPIHPYGSEVVENDVLFRIIKEKPITIDHLLTPERTVYAKHGGRFFWSLYSTVEKSAYYEYEKFIKDYYKYLYAEEEFLKRNLLEYFSEVEVDNLLINKLPSVSRDKLIVNEEKKHGTYIEYSIVYNKPLIRGSKIANRHGNKGTISKILTGNERLFDVNGNPVEVIVGPLSPLARINIGQLMELQMNRCTEAFVKNVFSVSKNKKQDLIKFINMVDNTYKKYYTKEVEKFLDSLSENEIKEIFHDIEIRGLEIIQPPFESVSYEQLKNLMDSLGLEEMEKITLPNGKTIEVTYGKVYFYRLQHEPEKKIIARSVGRYDSSFNQPLGGRKDGGGHRIGEMETWSLLAYEVYNFLVEYLNIKSDNPSERMRLIQHLITNNERYYKPRSLKTVSFDVFRNILKGIMIDLEIENDDK